MHKSFASIDSFTPINVALSAKYKRSIAYSITIDRMPVTLTKILDQLCRDKITIAEKYDEGSTDELKHIIGVISKLKSDVQTNKVLTPLNPSTKDADKWNNILSLEKEKLGKDPTWFECTFLFSDCYFFRRIAELFELSQTLSTLDPYHKQKDDALMGSMKSISSLCKYCNAVNQNIFQADNCLLKKEVIRMFQISLWGNQCDLALDSEKSGIKTDEAIKQVTEKQEYIIANDLERAWKVLHDARENSCLNGMKVYVDLVVDNAGYELVSDLCLSDFLTSSNLVDIVRIHVKNMPWFVSDAMKKDVLWTLSVFQLAECEDILAMASRWNEHFSSGRWQIIDDETFWTLPFPYNAMPTEDPELYENLKKTSLIIMKGDLNYRKLIGDINWNYSTKFSEALRGFSPAPLLALRTIKTEVLAGVDPSRFPEYKAKNPEWMLDGSYAVAQCFVP